MSGAGFSVEIPADWRLSRARGGVVARSGAAYVTVARFALRRPYDPSQFDAATKELDRVASELAAKSRATLTERRTTTVAGRRARAYGFANTRVGFVLVGRREYELLCSGQPDACDLLFSSFTVS